jgi:hypothetical protein
MDAFGKLHVGKGAIALQFMENLQIDIVQLHVLLSVIFKALNASQLGASGASR